MQVSSDYAERSVISNTKRHMGMGTNKVGDTERKVGVKQAFTFT